MRVATRLSPPARFCRDKNPEFYGRYRLWFDQLAPSQDDIAAVVPIRGEALVDVRAAFEVLERHQNWPLELVEDGARPCLRFEMLSDVCYIDMRNLHRAADWLAFGLEDARFFVYSSGDGPDDWLDEYVIEGGKLSVDRFRHEPYLRQSRLDFYLALLHERTDDTMLRRFVGHCLESQRSTPRGSRSER